MLLIGFAAIVNFRKRLRNNSFLLMLCLVAILTGVGSLLNGCGGSSSSSKNNNQTPQAATPTLSPGTGIYASVQTVTISDSTIGATIYYTTDGSTPTTSSAKYTAAISVTSAETIKAMATASGYTNSAVASAVYKMNIPIVNTVYHEWQRQDHRHSNGEWHCKCHVYL